MNRVLTYLFRLAIIIGGYLVAALCTSAFLVIVYLGTADFTVSEVPEAATGPLIFSIPFVALFVAYFAFIPAVFAILASELLGKRDWLFHALAGAIVALAVIAFFNRNRGASAYDEIAELNIVLAMIAAGMCGGIGYWLVAGRSAGGWRAREEPT